MKDIHTERSSPGAIPLISPILHCVAMTVLVYLRTSFGFAFLRPKSVFFAFSWAGVLFLVMAWNEPALWNSSRGISFFFGGCIILYWANVLRTATSDIRQNGNHDHYSGFSFLLPVIKAFTPATNGEALLHIWVEPSMVLIVALILRFVLAEVILSWWLIAAAGSLWLSEVLNFWFGEVRRRKIAKDMDDDARDQGSRRTKSEQEKNLPKTTRRDAPTTPRRRSTSSASKEAEFAQILGLERPYTLEQAEKKYRELIRVDHPDIHEDSKSGARAEALNAAIEHFRRTLK